MALLTPVFIGFFPKLIQPKPDWLKVSSVKEICSVSVCISKAPDNWVNQWKHNSMGYFDSESVAASLISDNSSQYDIYAYEVFPFYVDDGVKNEIAIEIKIGNPPIKYKFLGYDIVTKSSSDFFECSPLSCNHAAVDFATNDFCLIDNEADANHALFEMSKKEAGYEPGHYYLFKVYRKNRV